MPSFRLKIDPRRRAAGRFILSVRTALQKAFAEEQAERGLTRADLARTLDTHRSAITRWLGGSESLSMRTVADLAWAMGREPELVLRKAALRNGANEVRVSTSPPRQMVTSSANAALDPHRPSVRVVAG